MDTVSKRTISHQQNSCRQKKKADSLTRLEHREVGRVVGQQMQVDGKPRHELHQGLVDLGVRVVVTTRQGASLRGSQEELKGKIKDT